MIQNPRRAAEELIGSAEAFPTLSPGLRRRVLGATLRARRQQRRRRRVLLAVSFLVPILGLGVWYATMPSSAPNGERWADMGRDSRNWYGSRPPVREESVGEWDHVEDVVRFRKENSRILRGAIW